VAKSQTPAQQIGLTRGKAVLIGVLSLALVVVVYAQYSRFAGTGTQLASGKENGPPEVRAVRPSRRAAASAENAELAPGDQTQVAMLEFNQAKWKPPELEQVVAYDPFALPEAFPQPPAIDADGTLVDADAGATAEERAKAQADIVEALQAELEELQQRGVHVIFSQNNQYVAMIGDRTVHVGDEINGFVVTEIDPKEGVRIERNSSE
jgi:hypothetical protein